MLEVSSIDTCDITQESAQLSLLNNAYREIQILMIKTSGLSASRAIISTKSNKFKPTKEYFKDGFKNRGKHFNFSIMNL